MIPLNYHHLYYFYVIAKEGTISEASRQLHLAQPTLSAQLKIFEKSLKSNLFERNRKRLVLTEKGRTVFDYARRIFNLADEMREDVDKGSTGSREGIQIGVVSGLPRQFSRALVNAVLERHPEAHVNLVEGTYSNLLKRLEDLSLDVFLSEQTVSPGQGLECENVLVGKIPILFAAAPDLAKIYRNRIRQNKEIPLIVARNPPQVFYKVQDLLNSGKLKPRIVAEVQDVEVARLLALDRWGIAPVNAYSISQSQPERGLVPVKWIFPEPITENIYLILRRRKNPNPLARELIKSFHI